MSMIIDPQAKSVTLDRRDPVTGRLASTRPAAPPAATEAAVGHAAAVARRSALGPSMARGDGRLGDKTGAGSFPLLRWIPRAIRPGHHPT